MLSAHIQTHLNIIYYYLLIPPRDRSRNIVLFGKMVFGVRLPINDKIVYYLLLISVQMQMPPIIPKSKVNYCSYYSLSPMNRIIKYCLFAMNNRNENIMFFNFVISLL